MFLYVLTAAAFFVLITILILIHEGGHFFAARFFGVIVEEFGFGLPPKLWTIARRWGTAFTLNAIPFGGFVRLKGENSLEVGARAQEGSFARASIPVRCVILTAGVFMNFALALLIFTGGFSYGGWVPTYLTLDDLQAAAVRGDIALTMGTVVEAVRTDSGASEARLPVGGIIAAVDGTSVREPEDIVALQRGKSSVAYQVAVDGEHYRRKEFTSYLVRVSEGRTGVELLYVPLDIVAPRRSLLSGLSYGLREIHIVTSQTIMGIGHLVATLFSQLTVPQEVMGLIGIAHLTYDSVQQGFSVYLRLMGLLSLSLAILNILPFPALDGGRLLFVLSELFVRPGSRRVEVIIHTIGFSFLLLLIFLVTVYDVVRFIAR